MLPLTVRLRTRLTVTPIRLPVSLLPRITAPWVSVAPPSRATVLAMKMPDSALSRAMLSRKNPRVERSWAMPQVLLFSEITRSTLSRSVHEAQMPFRLKPETVSPRISTPVTGRSSVPMTQMPVSAWEQARPARPEVLGVAGSVFAAGGLITVRSPQPRSVSLFVISTFS